MDESEATSTAQRDLPSPDAPSDSGRTGEGRPARRPRSRWKRWRARQRRARRRRARERAMRTGPLDRRAEERARRRRRRRTWKRRSDLDRSEFEVARLRRQRRRATRRRTRREQRRRRAAQRSTRLQRWRDRPGRTQRAEARLRRALRLNTLRQKLPALSWYRGLPERSRPRRWEVAALAVIVAATGAVMATAAKDLTGIGAVDVGWAVAAGVVVPLTGARAPRPVLLVGATLAVVGVEGWWALAGVGAVALASGLVYRRRGRIIGLRVMHALSAALTLVALVHVPPMRGFPTGAAWTAASLAIAALVISAIVVSGWWNSAPRLRLASGVVVAVGAAVVVGLTASLWLAVRDSQLGADVALAATGTQLSTTDLAASLTDLEAAGPGLTLLADRLETPLWQPLRAVPIVAQQYEALETTVTSALDLVALAGDGADLVNVPGLRPRPGGVDLAALEALEVPLGDLVTSLDSAEARLSAVDGPSLLPGVARPVDDLRAAVADALPPPNSPSTVCAPSPECSAPTGPGPGWCSTSGRADRSCSW